MQVREARLEDVPGMARVKVDTWRTAYRGLMPDEYLDNLSYTDKAQPLYESLQNPDNDKFMYVAENDDGKIVGVITGGLERTGHPNYAGEVTAIYVLEEFQRNDIGKSLFRSAIEWFGNRKINSMLLWVLAGNKYIEFYKQLGGKKLDREIHDFKEFKAYLVCVGWEDLSIVFGEK